MNENVSLQIFGQTIPFTKETQKATANTLIAKVTNGEVDPINTFATIKAMSDCLSQFLKDKSVIDATVEAVGQYGKAGANYNGAHLCVTEAGVRYDFSTCQDPVWDDLARQKAELDAKIKERETFLRGVVTPQTIVVDETGEVKTIYGPAKTSATTIKVTFAK